MQVNWFIQQSNLFSYKLDRRDCNWDIIKDNSFMRGIELCYLWINEMSSTEYTNNNPSQAEESSGMDSRKGLTKKNNGWVSPWKYPLRSKWRHLLSRTSLWLCTVTLALPECAPMSLWIVSPPNSKEVFASGAVELIQERAGRLLHADSTVSGASWH